MHCLEDALPDGVEGQRSDDFREFSCNYNSVEENDFKCDTEKSAEPEEFFVLYNGSTIVEKDLFNVQLNIANSYDSLTFKIDTGADVSIISNL